MNSFEPLPFSFVLLGSPVYMDGAERRTLGGVIHKTLISSALRIGIEYLLVGGGEQELQWQEVYIFFRNEMPETIESLMNVDVDEYQHLKDAVVPFKAFADKARRDAASAALWGLFGYTHGYLKFLNIQEY